MFNNAASKKAKELNKAYLNVLGSGSHDAKLVLNDLIEQSRVFEVIHEDEYKHLQAIEGRRAIGNHVMSALNLTNRDRNVLFTDIAESQEED